MSSKRYSQEHSLRQAKQPTLSYFRTNCRRTTYSVCPFRWKLDEVSNLICRLTRNRFVSATTNDISFRFSSPADGTGGDSPEAGSDAGVGATEGDDVISGQNGNGPSFTAIIAGAAAATVAAAMLLVGGTAFLQKNRSFRDNGKCNKMGQQLAGAASISETTVAETASETLVAPDCSNRIEYFSGRSDADDETNWNIQEDDGVSLSPQGLEAGDQSSEDDGSNSVNDADAVERIYYPDARLAMDSIATRRESPRGSRMETEAPQSGVAGLHKCDSPKRVADLIKMFSKS